MGKTDRFMIAVRALSKTAVNIMQDSSFFFKFVVFKYIYGFSFISGEYHQFSLALFSTLSERNTQEIFAVSTIDFKMVRK